jgi:hypothetical protein
MNKPIEFTASQLGLIGLLIFVALIFILGHIGERDSKDTINNWRNKQ